MHSIVEYGLDISGMMHNNARRPSYDVVLYDVQYVVKKSLRR